jgi:hypothetical protein
LAILLIDWSSNFSNAGVSETACNCDKKKTTLCHRPQLDWSVTFTHVVESSSHWRLCPQPRIMELNMNPSNLLVHCVETMKASYSRPCSGTQVVQARHQDLSSNHLALVQLCHRKKRSRHPFGDLCPGNPGHLKPGKRRRAIGTMGISRISPRCEYKLSH